MPLPSRRERLNESRSTVIVDGKRLETLLYPANPGRPTIVMLHEGLGSISMWRDFPERLARATACGILVYSRYGHGKSDRLADRRSVDFMHHEACVVLPQLLAHFQIPSPILLGHSDGASIALIYAATCPAKPRALILEAPHTFVEDLTVASIAKIRAAYRSTDLREKLLRYHDFVDETFWGWNDIWLDPNFRSWNIENLLGAITCPVLVLQGTNDEYGTPAQLASIQTRVPHAQTLMPQHCGHSPHRDQPERTLEAISAFTARLPTDP